MIPKITRLLFTLSLVICMVLSLGITAYAAEANELDSSVPEASEVEVVPEVVAAADGPNTVILDLGPEWAAVEFEVASDSGASPLMGRVSPEGTLTIDLDGGFIYTLRVDTQSLPEGGVPLIGESQTQPDKSAPTDDDASGTPEEPVDEPAETDTLLPGIPNLHLFLFAGGLLICIGALVTMAVLKRRRQANDYDADDEDYEDE